MLEHDVIVIAAGGGSIPVTFAADGRTRIGIEAMIDRDLCSASLAAVGVDLLLIATDVDAIYADWRTPRER